MFADGLTELDDAREIVHNLIEEYKACERPDYADWNSPGKASSTPSEPAHPGHMQDQTDSRMPSRQIKRDD